MVAIKSLSFLLIFVALCKANQTCLRSVVSDEYTNVMSSEYSGRASYVYPNPAWSAQIPGARWIWKRNSNQGSSIDYFYKYFYLNSPSLGLIEIAADDAFYLFLNDKFTYCSCTSGCFYAQNKRECIVSKYLVRGINKLVVRLQNYGGPGGLIFKLLVA